MISGVVKVTGAEKLLESGLAEAAIIGDRVGIAQKWLGDFIAEAAPYRALLQNMYCDMLFFGHLADIDTAVEFFDIWITFFTRFSVCLHSRHYSG
jgi:hypothetical protein